MDGDSDSGQTWGETRGVGGGGNTRERMLREGEGKKMGFRWDMMRHGVLAMKIFVANNCPFITG